MAFQGELVKGEERLKKYYIAKISGKNTQMQITFNKLVLCGF
jgi:hypothetical protein